MKIGDRIYVRGYIDEIRKDTVIARNDGGYFGTIPSEVITGELPSAQPETTRILAEALNGSPLLYPCDKLWSREGWCKDHCKKGQTEPDTECWLKYAETIAAERREE